MFSIVSFQHFQLIGPHLASKRSHSSSVPNVNLWPDPAFAYLQRVGGKKEAQAWRRGGVILKMNILFWSLISGVVVKDQSDDSLICTLFSLST